MAEGTALEMRCAGNCTEGSNPSRSDAFFGKTAFCNHGRFLRSRNKGGRPQWGTARLFWFLADHLVGSTHAEQA